MLEKLQAYQTDSAGTKSHRGERAQEKDQSLRVGQLFHWDEVQPLFIGIESSNLNSLHRYTYSDDFSPDDTDDIIQAGFTPRSAYQQISWTPEHLNSDVLLFVLTF